jgi:HAD superfamily hydrolase (TIGR01490 family)
MSAPQHQSITGYDFFDIDHTIVNASTGLQYALTGIKSGLLSKRILLAVPRLYLQYHFGEMDLQKARRAFREMKGLSRGVVQNLGEINFDKRIRGTIFLEAQQLINSLSTSGRGAVFITSSFHHVVNPLAEFLHVPDVLANSLVYENEITTGAVQEPFLFGIEKKRAALRFLQERNVSPIACSFHTDSINDRSLLEIVGKPVAVNPGWRLRKLAQERKWETVYFKLTID